VERPAKRPLTAKFEGLPNVGDRFKGTVIYTEAGTIYIELPGLSAENVALGVIAPANNPERRKFKDGATVTCEVLSIDPDPKQKGLMLVQCQRE
jgi:ribosomal protein S1